ncbi:hypothetical protein TI39_contig4305g00007 [Zymoseptoria brevis]|uniref:MYND-type domain-containing protein n=1 Tax=Zymoseptoria brevis TaxID=1047168 RepID=A0A0F4GBD7_9PEZI|nr:hypothetical protein TI39_contig4305g00007 [Zymoseptoria brevis]
MTGTATSRVPECAMCTEPGLLHCGGCKAINYCSVECRDASWRFHKSLCKTFKDFQSPPSENMYRALYFPPSGRKPIFRWLSKLKMPDMKTAKDNDIGPIIDAPSHISACRIFVSSLTGKELKWPMTIFCDNDWEARYPLPNKALLESTQNLVGQRWGGPLVVTAGEPGGQDFNMVDFQRLIAFAILFDGSMGSCTLEYVFGPKIQAVLMPCAGERRLSGVTSARPAMVPRLHLMGRTQEYMSAVSEHIGLPLMVLKYATKSKAWTEPDDLTSDAMYMHVGSAKNSRLAFTSNNGAIGVCNVPNDGMGNMLVVRADGKPLDSETVNIFVDFCRTYPMATIMRAKKGGKTIGETYEGKKRYGGVAEAFLNQISPVDWVIYQKEWKALKAETEASEAISNGAEGQVVADGSEVTRAGLTDRVLGDLAVKCVKMRQP